MYVYITTNTINGKKYIGMSSREEDDGYLGSGALIKNAIRKYGKDSFTKEVIEHCTSFEELCIREQFWIDFYEAVDSDMFYNLIDGGLGGNSNKMKEYWGSMTDEERKGSRNWNTSPRPPCKYRQDPKFRKKLSDITQQTWNNRTKEERRAIGDKVSKTRKDRGVGVGSKNSMAGRSAITENNLKWYTDGVKTIYVTEGTAPPNFRRGRTYKRKNQK